MIVFKFVELTVVTEESLEDAVNMWVAQGWELEDIRFVITEHSRRPSMAFVSFTRDVPAGVHEAEVTAEREAVTLNDLPVTRLTSVPAMPDEAPPIDDAGILDLQDPTRRR
jgi:hypothetical protein